MSEKSEEEFRLGQVPIFPERFVALPNEIVRSALFSASNRPRTMMKREEIYATNNVKIMYTGESLRVSDDSVILEELIYRARNVPHGNWVQFKQSEIIKALGWHNNKTYQQRFKNSIARMKSGTAEIFSPMLRRTILVSLIRKVEKDEPVKRGQGTTYRVKFESEVIALFDKENYTRIRKDKRKLLSPIALHLFRYYSSHTKPFAIKLTTLKKLVGSSESSKLSVFRKNLLKALDQLKDIEFLWSYELSDNDLVTVERWDTYAKSIEHSKTN